MNDETEVLTWYWLGGRKVLNFGEHFVELLLPKLGCRPRSFDVERKRGHIQQGENCLLMIGSEFEAGLVGGLIKAGCHVHVWGQGNGRGAHRAVDMRLDRWRDNITIHALRGPLTKRVSHFEGDVPLVDPGFLLPRFFPPNEMIEGCTGVLYVPHHANTRRVDSDGVDSIGAESILNVMLPRKQLQSLMHRLASAEFALVNSLHAFIFCLAYKVPCAICLMEHERLDMPDKWRDVLESLGRPEDESLPVVKDIDEGWRWWQDVGQHITIPDTTPLLEAFPFG